MALSALLLGFPSLAAGQDAARVSGRVTSGDRAVPSATVTLVDAQLGSLTRATGDYVIERIVPGRYRVRASAIGYASQEREVVLESGASLRLDFELRPEAVPLNPVVVTGTMKETTVAESTVKVSVVPAAVLQRNATNNLMESLQYVNGLYQQVDCGVCFTNNIRINGMEGPYTAVLIDGMPIMSSLASVYGLNGINPALIERIEILKGPASTLYGSEAMGGVVNVITRSARFAPRLAIDGYRTSYGESNLDAAAATELFGSASGLVSGNYAHLGDFHDDNGDGFSDAPLYTRSALFGKLEVAPRGRRILGLTAKYYSETRFGGVRDWTEEDRGSESVYGEAIDTRRFELIGSYVLPLGGERLRTEFSATRHEQDSHYGATSYDARQDVLFGNLLWDLRIGGSHDLLIGATLRHQRYDDDTPATVTAERRSIPGILVQDEWTGIDDLAVLGGLRVDHHRDHGAILSPRFSVRWEPWHDTTIRLNTGSGFRVVNLFTEDHAALTGAREVEITEALEPERSYSVALNVNQIIEFGPNPMMIDVDAFFTRFSNKITPDYDSDPDKILYRNLNGYSVSRGFSISLNQNVGFERLLYSFGGTIQDVYSVREGSRSSELFSPEFTATFGLTYNHPRPAITLDYTGRLTGPMRLPEYPEPYTRPTGSRTYSVHDAQLSLGLAEGARIYLSGRNLFDFRQGSPLVDPGNPFGDAFDTNYVWGPIKGRELVVGARFGLSR